MGKMRLEKVNVNAVQLGVAERARLHAGRPGFQSRLCRRQPLGCHLLSLSSVRLIFTYGSSLRISHHLCQMLVQCKNPIIVAIRVV